MMSEDAESKIRQLKQAMAAQEGLRGTLDDAIVDATLAALRKQLAELEGARPSEQQRKLMTVLFMDVVDSTRLLRGLDPEENLAIMDAALQRLAEPIKSHGGRVLRFMGDGFLAVFGLPRARENDPEMAVRAGLQVLERARTIARKLEREHQLKDFQVRVGVNTGLVVAGGVTEGDGTIMGDAVNLTARLESSAPPGGLLISQDTHQHVRGLFELEPGEVFQAKGFDEPVEAYLVRRARPRAFRLTTRGVEGVETRMIGRDAELRALQEAMQAVNAGPTARFIAVVGEAGLGKSRLLAEFGSWLELQTTEVVLLKGRASLEMLDLPYGLLRDLIAHRVGILDDDLIPEVRQKIVAGFEEALGADPNLERNAHFVGQLLGYDFRDSPHLTGVLDDPEQIHDRALVYLAEYLGALAAQRLLVIFLDDIHWADVSSLDVLLGLFNKLANQRLLVISLARPSLFERWPAWEQVVHYRRLDLQPLSRFESQQLVGEVLQKVAELPVSLQDLITENAAGNPFYLEELIKMLVEDGVIVKGEQTWRIQAERLGEVRIPSTLTGVVQARIDSLPPVERRILQQASVVGKVFWDETICYINQDGTTQLQVERLDAPETRHTLGSLQSREMISQQETSAFSDCVEFLFNHAVLREVTYEGVLKRLRRAYHAMVAEWLISHSGDRTGEITGLIAGHLEKAEKRAEALEYLIQAAETAVSNYAIDGAGDFYTRALALTEEDDLESRYRLLRGRAEVLGMQGNRDAQRADLDTLASIADHLSDDRKRAEVSLARGWLAFWVGEFPATKAAAQRTIDLAEGAGLQHLIGKAYDALAWAHLQMGDHDEALRHAKTTLDQALITDDLPLQASSFIALGMVQSGLGDYPAARGSLMQALSLARELGDLKREATVLNNLGVALTLLGDYQNAAEKYQESLERSRELGYRILEATSVINLAWVSSACADWDSAGEHAQAGVVLARKAEYNEALAECLIWLGHTRLGLGQPEGAIAAYQESLAIRRDLGQSNLAIGVIAGLARAARAQDDMGVAVEHVNEIMAHFEEGGTLLGTWEPLRIYLTCYQVLKDVQDPRADYILDMAYTLLQEQATKITEESDRRLYLENVPWHREIVRIWERRQEMGSSGS